MAGRYELHETLGTGAFATVYRGTDPRLDASVAVKMLADNWSLDDDVRRRFRSEAVLMRRVQAEADVPGLIDVFDIDETNDGQPFIVMAFADRGTLASRTAGRAWPVEDVLPVIDALAETVGALHGAGVVHRDLKPSNLLLRSDRSAEHNTGLLVRPGERLLVSDLGLAKDANLDTSRLSFAAGTPRYMAPEQYAVGSKIDHRADIHAASVMIAELLGGTDELPPLGTTYQGNLPASIPAPVRAVLDQGVATDPMQRQQSMHQWHQQLRSALTATARTTATTRAGSRRPTRLTAIAAVAAVAAVAIAAIVGWFALGSGDGLRIVGPDEVVVGEPAIYRIAQGDTATWTDWTGAQIESDQFEVLASLPGQLQFSAESGADRVTQTVEVIESGLGPTINGPDSIRLGQSAVFTATLPVSTSTFFWIAPDGQRIESAGFTFTPDAAGPTVISLVATDNEGIERGSRILVEVQS